MEQMYCYGCMMPKTQTPVCEHCGFDDRKQNDPHQLPMGTVLQNQYIVGRVLGQGGFGITYIGWDRNLAIPVAIKEFFPSGTVHRQSTVDLGVTCYTGGATEAFISHRDRFLKEARTLAQLSGVPEIVQVRNFFTSHNTAYIIMEYVQGITLKAYLKQLGRRMTVQEVLDVMKPVLKALSKVHSKHLIHRDISPDNIMLPTGGGVKLIDFGTVRNMDNGMQTKSTESIMKPGFAPIEQYQTRGNLGTWTDVYALSATIHYCMTGKVPEDALERLENGGALTHLHNVPGMPPKVLAVLEKGLAVRIADRIQTVDEMYSMLYGEPITGTTGTITGFHAWQPPVVQQPQTPPVMQNPKPVSAPESVPHSAVNPMPASASGPQVGAIFAPFKGRVPDQVLQYCESVAHKPILVETYLQQCVAMGRLTQNAAKTLQDHYNQNKPAPKPEPKPVYAPNPHAQIVDDGTIFGRFKGHVPSFILEYCESVAHKPILVETYLQQCVNRDRITRERAKEMLAHYQSVPHPAASAQQEQEPEQKKSRKSTDGSIFGGFRTEVSSTILDYCESVAHKPVLVETYLQQCVNRGRLSAEYAEEMLTHYKQARPAVQAAPASQPVLAAPAAYPNSMQQGNMLYCSECGKQIPENSKFCCHCGSGQKPVTESYPRWYCAQCKMQIPQDSKYCRSCGRKVVEPVILRFPEGHCQNCGVQLMPGSKFCFSCGTPTQQAQTSKYPQGHCQTCGNKLSEDAKFCVYCGTPVKS